MSNVGDFITFFFLIRSARDQGLDMTTSDVFEDLQFVQYYRRLNGLFYDFAILDFLDDVQALNGFAMEL
jgi:hypothetical protein